MKPSFGTCCYFHHPYLFSAWNMACQVKGKNANISFIMRSPSQMSTGPVMLVVSCLMVMPNWKKDCFSKEGIQPCKRQCPKANALVWIMFGALLQNQVKWTIFITDLCIAEMSSWVSCLTTVPITGGPRIRSSSAQVSSEGIQAGVLRFTLSFAELSIAQERLMSHEA